MSPFGEYVMFFLTVKFTNTNIKYNKILINKGQYN